MPARTGPPSRPLTADSIQVVSIRPLASRPRPRPPDRGRARRAGTRMMPDSRPCGAVRQERKDLPGRPSSARMSRTRAALPGGPAMFASFNARALGLALPARPTIALASDAGFAGVDLLVRDLVD